MVGFRRCITALAVLALFAGLASAQVTGNTQLQCSTNVSVTPSLRVEGLTEQTGDIVLTCSGGFAATPGAQVPQASNSPPLQPELAQAKEGQPPSYDAAKALGELFIEPEGFQRILDPQETLGAQIDFPRSDAGAIGRNV